MKNFHAFIARYFCDVSSFMDLLDWGNGGFVHLTDCLSNDNIPRSISVTKTRKRIKTKYVDEKKKMKNHKWMQCIALCVCGYVNGNMLE